MIKCIGMHVGFTAPDWFPPERLETSRPVNDSQGNYYRTEYDNSAVESLHKLKGVIETSFGWVCGNHVIVECPAGTKNIQKWIKNTEKKLDRFFNRYIESQREAK